MHKEDHVQSSDNLPSHLDVMYANFYTTNQFANQSPVFQVIVYTFDKIIFHAIKEACQHLSFKSKTVSVLS